MRKGVKKWNKNTSYFFSLIKVKERKITLYKHLHYNHIPYHLLTHYIWYQLSAPGVPGSILDLGSRNIRGIFFCIILGTLYMEDRNRSHFWETIDKKYHHNWCGLWQEKKLVKLHIYKILQIINYLFFIIFIFFLFIINVFKINLLSCFIPFAY